MATDSRQLRNYISRRVYLGQSTRSIFTAVKSDRKFKRTPNTRIQSIIDEFRLAVNRAKAANKGDRYKTIGEVIAKDKKKRPKRICVNYVFSHNAGGRSARTSANGSDELSSIEVDSTMTIYEVRGLIFDQIRNWLDRHYEVSNIRSIKASLHFSLIQEC